MKKAVLAGFMIAAAGAVVAQPNKVQNAFSFHRYYEQDKKADDLLNAKSNIDDAAVNESTMGKAKTWFYRGKVYQAMAQSKDPKIVAASDNAIEQAVISFKKAIELDTKGEFPESKQRLNSLSGLAINKGISFYEAKDYVSALKNFETAIDLANQANRVDTMAIYNAALAAEKAKDYNKAISNYKRLTELKYGGGNTYSFLAAAFKANNQPDLYIQTIQAGRKADPNDKNLIIEELNYNLQNNKTQEAINNLNLAIQNDPSNHILYFSLGAIYDNMANNSKEKLTDAQYLENVSKAEQAYKKCLEVKPDYFDGLYGLGSLYFNHAVKINEKASNITDNNAYAKEMKKVDEKFNVALPYLEKAYEINNNDMNTLLSLKQLYARTGQTEKYNKVKEKLQN